MADAKEMLDQLIETVQAQGRQARIWHAAVYRNEKTGEELIHPHFLEPDAPNEDRSGRTAGRERGGSVTAKLTRQALTAAAQEGVLFQFLYFAVAVHEKSGAESLVYGTLAETAAEARAKYLGAANGYRLARIAKIACIEIPQEEKKVSGV